MSGAGHNSSLWVKAATTVQFSASFANPITSGAAHTVAISCTTMTRNKEAISYLIRPATV